MRRLLGIAAGAAALAFAAGGAQAKELVFTITGAGMREQSTSSSCFGHRR
jgi:hypothetical protein